MVVDERAAKAPSSDIAAPSFKDKIQPIIQDNCASCHTSGKIGAHVLDLSTAGDVKAVATGIQLATSSGYMPPWPASDVGVPLKHDRSLTPEEIASIVQWDAAGAPLDVDPATPVKAPEKPQGPTIRVDQTLPLPEPYQGSTKIRNDYRCFALDPKLDATSWLTGFDFLADQVAVVHHGVAYRMDASLKAATEATDAQAAGSGWPCLSGSTGVKEATESAGPGKKKSDQFAAWAPGQSANKYPDGSGVKMEPGDFFVMQVHYHFLHTAPADQSKFLVEFQRSGEMDEIDLRTYHGPAEIPCKADESGPLCDRNAMLDKVAADYGLTSRIIPNALLQLCGQKPEDYAHMTDGKATSRCDQKISASGELVNMFVHEHEIGRSIRLTLNPGTPEEKILVDVPDWDFGWQMVYEPAEKIMVKRGDTIRIDCAWDRALFPSTEPQYVIWSMGSQDEMCYSFISTRRTDG